MSTRMRHKYILCLSALFALAPRAVFSADCYQSKINKLDISCDKQKNLDMHACEQAAQLHKEAEKTSLLIRTQVCQKINEIKAKIAQCAKANDSQGCVSDMSSEVKNAIDSGVAKLNNILGTQTNNEKTLVDTDIQDAYSKGVLDKNWRLKNLKVEDESAVVSDKSRLPAEVGDTPQQGRMSSIVFQEQLDAYNKIEKSRTQIKKDISNLMNLATGFNNQAAITGNRRNGMSTANPSDQSTMTGDPATKSAGDAQQSGGGGGGGGGSGQSQQSAVTDPANSGGSSSTSPTPLSPNAGGAASQTADTTRSVPPPPTKGGVDISNLRNPQGSTAGPNGSAHTDLAALPVAAASTSPSDGGARRTSSSTGASYGSVGGGSGGSGPSGGSLKSDSKAVSGGASAPAASGGAPGNGDGAVAAGDDALAPFGTPLSDPKFTLAGSETDASVKNMMGSFNADASSEANRDPASDVSDGVGERDGAELWDRVHERHQRCVQKGCVSYNARHGRSGG